VTLGGYDAEEYTVQYLISLHWSMAQFTPGASPVSPHTIGERWFGVSVLALGLVVATCFVSSITSTLNAMWSMNRNASTQQFLLKKFLKQSGISRSLGARVTRYIESVIEIRHKRVHASKVAYLSMLSGPLNIELQSEILAPRLNSHPMFEMYGGISKSSMNELCVRATGNVEFAKGDEIFEQGTPANKMYFLSAGTLGYRVYKLDGSSMTGRLRVRQWCSEQVLWMKWEHCGRMRAVCYVDIITVNSQSFQDVASSRAGVFKFVQAHALNFLASYEREELTDIPPHFETDVSRSKTTEARILVQEAEDTQAQVLTFDGLSSPFVRFNKGDVGSPVMRTSTAKIKSQKDRGSPSTTGSGAFSLLRRLSAANEDALGVS
jgi:hypothetical protein